MGSPGGTFWFRKRKSEGVNIRDYTMDCDTMNQCDANDIVMYMTTI